MSAAPGLAVLVLLLVVGGLIYLGVRLWKGREEQEGEAGSDLIPYLLMALAVGVAGFSLSRLGRASLSPDRLTGRPTGEIAGALAGLVVAAPVAYLLWRRQARRRSASPGGFGWPIYLAVIEVVFLTAFFIAVAQLAETVNGGAITAHWPDLLVFGGIVLFHWWAERHDPPREDAGDIARLVGSGIALIALAIGLIGTVDWLLSLGFDAVWGLFRIPDPAVPLALGIAAVPIWAWRWLPSWEDESNVFRRSYLGFVTSVTLIMTLTAVVALLATLLTFILGMAGRAQEHFGLYPEALAFALAGGALWFHHRRRIGRARTGALRGYEYGMAGAGLGTLTATSVALIITLLEPSFAGNTAVVLIVLACSVIASGSVWLWFWRKVQAAPRETEVRALQRRFYLIGMTIITGLTAAGALISALIVIFRALLGEQTDIADSLDLPVTLTVLSGLAAWHLFSHVRTDGTAVRRTELRPFTVTVLCSHPGGLASRLPKEATTRVIYRADGAGVVDDAMADDIVAAVGTSSSLIWVDGDGFRVATARES